MRSAGYVNDFGCQAIEYSQDAAYEVSNMLTRKLRANHGAPFDWQDMSTPGGNLMMHGVGAFGTPDQAEQAVRSAFTALGLTESDTAEIGAYAIQPDLNPMTLECDGDDCDGRPESHVMYAVTGCGSYGFYADGQRVRRRGKVKTKRIKLSLPVLFTAIIDIREAAADRWAA